MNWTYITHTEKLTADITISRKDLETINIFGEDYVTETLVDPIVVTRGSTNKIHNF